MLIRLHVVCNYICATMAVLSNGARDSVDCRAQMIEHLECHKNSINPHPIDHLLRGSWRRGYLHGACVPLYKSLVNYRKRVYLYNVKIDIST